MIPMPITHQPPTPQANLSDNGRVPIITVENLHFHYHDGVPALRGVSLAIRRGEKVALVGPNGAGKSTLMLHLNGLLGEETAPVAVGGMALSKENLPYIRAKVGLVFQNPDDQLFSPTVFDDVAFGPLHMGYPEEEVRRRTERALEQVGMSGLAERLSHHLSVGQKKRVAIATVLSMDPEILVLDEPTAGLDPRGRRDLINLLHDLPLTMLVSTHDMRLVQELFPRLVVLDEGRVVVDGDTSRIMANAPLLQQHGLEAV
jgi:cobalt transport protein ATP-binding subunit